MSEVGDLLSLNEERLWGAEDDLLVGQMTVLKDHSEDVTLAPHFPVAEDEGFILHVQSQKF